MQIGEPDLAKPTSVRLGAAPGRPTMRVGCDEWQHPDETFRGTMRGRTPDGQPATVIVTRQGHGRDGHVWLTFDGAIKTTVMMTDGETGQLGELLGKATVQR
ncbi:MAG: hypothetical protein ACRDST_18170 [Pseudonocardiaceae bacterium]